MRIVHPLRPPRSIDAPLFERLTPRLKDSKQHFIGAGTARLAVNDDVLMSVTVRQGWHRESV
jgi:hypothetical protein